jgi:hypothetical protein
MKTPEKEKPKLRISHTVTPIYQPSYNHIMRLICLKLKASYEEKR